MTDNTAPTLAAIVAAIPPGTRGDLAVEYVARQITSAAEAREPWAVTLMARLVAVVLLSLAEVDA